LSLDLKLLTTGITLNFNKSYFYDEFTNALKNEGFKQKFYSIGRLVGTDSQGKPLKQTFEEPSGQKSDQYNMVGKYCLTHPYGNMLVVGQNSTHGGVGMELVPDLTNEMKFILDIFWNTTKISRDDIVEGALIAAISISDDENLDTLSHSSKYEHAFEDMILKEYGDETILNPDFYRDMNPKEVSEYIQAHPEVMIKSEGWREIKVKYSEHQYIISFEYQVKDSNKMIDMLQHPEDYCYGIIRKFRIKQ